MFDVVIVGAGAAGCVLANRLSQDTARKVLLVEAGPDYPNEESLPLEIAQSLSKPVITHDWGYASEADEFGRSIPIPRAKVVGGCTATNATVALRGLRGDFDEWVEFGNSGWSFEEVLPFFRKLETDHDFDDEWHGTSGLFPISRNSHDELTLEQAAFLDACLTNGHARINDHNAPDQHGCGLMPKNTIGGIRQSTSLTYLAPARCRRNLSIRGDTLIQSVVFEKERATGVRVAGSGEEIRADTVIISAGAYGSPVLLMRSGVGPSAHLSSHGISCRIELAGVGENLSDHPLWRLNFATKAPPPVVEAPMIQTVLTMQSELRRYKYDLQVFPRSVMPVSASANETKHGDFGISIALLKPHSKGRVRLRSNKPAERPVIDLGYFTNSDDMPRMVEAARNTRKIAGTSPLSDLLIEEIYPGAHVDSDFALAAQIRSDVRTIHHPVGTCRMGSDSENGAVVDRTGKLHGAENVYVVDASIMPTVPAANTNVPTIMVAERCAEWLQACI